MAGKIKLTPAELLAQSQEMFALQKEYESLFGGTDKLLQQVNGNWSANLAHNFAGKITSAQSACSSVAGMLGTGASLAKTSAETYTAMDFLLAKAMVKMGTQFNAKATEVRDGIYGKSSETTSKVKIENEGGWMGFGNTERYTDFGLTGGGKLTEHKRDSLFDDTTYKDIKTGKEIDPKKAPTFYKPVATIAESKMEAGVSASVFDSSISTGENSSLGMSVLKGEAHASVSGGLYVIGADGEKKFSPGVNAEVGASASVIDVNWDQQWLGDENLGLSTNVGVTVGKVEGKAQVNAQVFGEDGKLNVQAYGKASAEAIAGEIEGSANINVLGGSVGVKGSVNVGIGAHAEVGIKDGVVKCDIGASLGLGASVSFEVDVGGMVNKGAKAVGGLVDGAKSAWNNFWK